MLSCNWYLSSSLSPEATRVVQCMANALRKQARNISLEVINEKDSGLRAGFERVKNVFSKRSIWHLFGEAPIWWPAVRLHSRTVHTSLDENYEKIEWGGYPTRLFSEQAHDTEAVICPAFGSMSSHSEDREKAVYVCGTLKDLPEGDFKVVDISGACTRDEVLSGIYIAEGTGPLEAMRAGILTMRGLAISSKKSVFLDEILGSDGYFLIDDELSTLWEDAIKRVIRHGLSDKGRHLAISSRHFVKERFSDEKCADSLISVYRKVSEGKN